MDNLHISHRESMLRDVYTVTRLNRAASDLLDAHFPIIWLEGEISNLARPSSGHLYFSLKDATAQVRCAMFRMSNQQLTFPPANGTLVLVRARVTLYETRGDFQLVVEHMEEAGDGALRQAFEVLKQRLAGEGLYDNAHKRKIPVLPHRIGVITSPSGAAIRDILSVLKRRFPAIPVLIYPVPVQGAGAANEIALAIDHASQRKECDVLIITRGGGSLEDLWAFNEEPVARAIYACNIPVVTGVGHEIDITIADFVADQRAATPSAAAELVSPDSREWIQESLKQENHLIFLMDSRLKHLIQNLTWLQKRLQHPGRRLLMQAQRVDELEQRLSNAHKTLFYRIRSKLLTLSAGLHQHTPLYRLQQLENRRQALRLRLQTAGSHHLQQSRQRLAAVSRGLHALSPLATLGRGYAIIYRLPERTLLQSSHQTSTGERIEAHLAQGRLICRVEKTA